MFHGGEEGGDAYPSGGASTAWRRGVGGDVHLDLRPYRIQAMRRLCVAHSYRGQRAEAGLAAELGRRIHRDIAQDLGARLPFPSAHYAPATTQVSISSSSLIQLLCLSPQLPPHHQSHDIRGSLDSAHLIPRLWLLQTLGDLRAGYMRSLGVVRVGRGALQSTVRCWLRVQVGRVVRLGRVGEDAEFWSRG